MSHWHSATRQVRTTSGPLDLLGIDETGALHIIELKRDLLPREAVTQALDYASWLGSLPTNELLRIAEDYLEVALEEKFQDEFGVELPEIDPHNHRILVVGTGLDAGAERLISYLSQDHSVRINAVFFKYVKTKVAELLVRSVLVPETLTQRPRRRTITVAELLELAKTRNVEEAVRILRSLASAGGSISKDDEYVWEDPSWAYGAGFRYWRVDRKGNKKIMFGINLTDKWGAKKGEVDVWVRQSEIAQASHASAKAIQSALSGFQVVDSSAHKRVIRIPSAKVASKFINVLKGIFDK